MFSDSDDGEERTSRIIIPRSRRAIHDLPNLAMVYQPRDINKTTQPSESEEDYDEVDNIISKLVKPTSPIAARRQFTRRSSEILEKNNDTTSEDILSKSSPAVFYLYNYRDENYQHDNSRRSNTSGSDIAYDYKLESSSQQLTNPEPQRSEKNSSNSKYILPFIIALIGMCYFVYCNYDSKIGFKIYDKLNFYEDVKCLAQKYKIKQDSMLQVRTGIDTIFKKEDTGCFIFVYDGNEGVSPVQFNDFMDDIASAASKYLRNNTRNIQHVVLDNNKVITFKSDTDLIHEFRENVVKTGVLLVKNIERVPAKLAMAFHYYCDEYNPLVKKSAIFFTLDVSKCKIPLLNKRLVDHDYIERCLKDKWRDIDPDKIGPLLTRVVAITVDVTNI